MSEQTISCAKCPRCGKPLNTRRGNYCAFCGWNEGSKGKNIKMYEYGGI